MAPTARLQRWHSLSELHVCLQTPRVVPRFSGVSTVTRPQRHRLAFRPVTGQAVAGLRSQPGGTCHGAESGAPELQPVRQRAVEGPIEAQGRRVMEHLERTGQIIPDGHQMHHVLAVHGWGSPEVHRLLYLQVDGFARVLACSYKAAADFMVCDAGILGVSDRHIARCLITIREILPGIDASELIRRKPELVLEADAMIRAREAVCVISAKGLNPIELVNRRPLVLLRHDVWFSDPETSCSWDESGAMEHDAP